MILWQPNGRTDAKPYTFEFPVTAALAQCMLFHIYAAGIGHLFFLFEDTPGNRTQFFLAMVSARPHLNLHSLDCATKRNSVKLRLFIFTTFLVHLVYFVTPLNRPAFTWREVSISTPSLSRNGVHGSRPAGTQGLAAEVRHKLFRTSSLTKQSASRFSLKTKL